MALSTHPYKHATYAYPPQLHIALWKYQWQQAKEPDKVLCCDYLKKRTSTTQL